MNFTEEHFNKLKNCASKIDTIKLADWFLKKGYFPEGHVLPPCFSSENFSYQNERKSNNKWTELKTISLPKTNLSVREFGIIDPTYFHDIVGVIKENWDEILNQIFSPNTKIFSYSFPIPLNFDIPGEIEKNRTERLIYEFIESAEKDLIADGTKFEYVVHSDIKNCYPSIYSHSIPWSFKGRKWSREHQGQDEHFSNKLDKLIHCAHDGCTNGISIGSALSDLIAELILAKIDVNISNNLTDRGIDFIGVRFKDDYRILVKTKKDGELVIDTLQSKLREFKFQIHEDKTEIKELPKGLYREHIMRYEGYSFRKKPEEINFKEFEKIYYEVTKIDEEIPNTGIIAKFIGELVEDCTKIKVNFGGDYVHKKNKAKFISLIWKMYNRSPKILPSILGIFELMIEQGEEEKAEIIDLLKDKAERVGQTTDKKDYFFLCWTYYFFRTNQINVNCFTNDNNNAFWDSIFANQDLLFSNSGFISFVPLETCKEKFGNINKNVNIFQKNTPNISTVTF